MKIIVVPFSLTMTSREIADVTFKNHGDVMRDIRKMLDDLAIDQSKFADIFLDGYGREQPCFKLPYDETICLLTGYNAAARMAVIKRWKELEVKKSPALPDFTNPVIAARAWADAKESEQVALVALEHAKPAIAFVDKYVEGSGLKGFREVCKLLKANESQFRSFLISGKIFYRLGGSLTAHQNHIDAGRFDVRTGIADSEHVYTTTKFTPKGINWIAGEWAKHQLFW